MTAGIGHNNGPALFQDRQYQTEAVQSIWTYFMSHAGNPLIAMPTGTGKSVVIARFLQSVFMRYPTQRILILTHSKELFAQNYKKLKGLWPFSPAGIYSAGLNSKNSSQPITFAGIASIVKQAALFGHIDLVLIDECHLLSPNENTMYQKFIADLMKRNPYLKVVGFTATPWRLGHGRLTDPIIKTINGEEVEIPSLFTEVCFDITHPEAFARLLAEGFLSPVAAVRTKTLLDVSGVHMRGGDFIEKELQEAVDRDDITEAALREAIELGADRRKWLVFASGVEHSENVSAMLNMMGVSARCVHSKMEDDRDEVLEAHKRGEFTAVVNNNVLTTGYDDPEIDFIIILRPTASSVLWVQMLGRGTRPLYAPGYDLNTFEGRWAAIYAGGKKNCLVADYAANSKRLGPIDDPLIPARKGKGGGVAPVKECPACERYVHASKRFCTEILDNGTICNHEFIFESKLNLEASSDALIKGELPIVSVFKVDHITVVKHTKAGVPPMARVSYYCGNRKFEEFLCPEHKNYAAVKARQWWKKRSENPMPETADELMRQMEMIPQATHLRVWVNKRYPEIMASCIDGTAFGTEEARLDAPQLEVDTPRSYASAGHDLDDDIPF